MYIALETKKLGGRLKKIFMLLLGLCISLSLNAQNKRKKKSTGLIGHSVEKSHSADYGMSGCGLGSVLFGETESRGGQVLSSTTNSIYSNNTFGMMSGTSNCSQDNSEDTAAVRKNMENFIAVNQQALANDIAKNQGENLIALSDIMGCTDVPYLGAKLQSEYNDIFSEKTIEVITDQVYESVASDRYLTENCKL